MSEKSKPKFDKNSPEARMLQDQITNGTFTQEGTLAAFPLCFPGATIPIPADESRITALDVDEHGLVYGGTSGKAAHLFVGMFHGVTGAVLDKGEVSGADQCVAVGCGKTKITACVNGPDGGRVVTAALDGRGHDLIQEWGYSRPKFQDLGKVNGERMVHGVVTNARTSLVGITTGSLFTVDVEEGKITVLGEVPGSGRIAIGSEGGIFGLDGPRHLWRYNAGSRKLDRKAVELPGDPWDGAPLSWARDARSGLLYTADARGNLFSFDEKGGFSSSLGRTPLAPVGPMSVTHDGRLFGFCGSELAKMFCYHPGLRQVTNLGVAVSVLERRRYGYAFGAAVTGRDGQVIFGEDDDLGHLWLYFPRIQTQSI